MSTNSLRFFFVFLAVAIHSFCAVNAAYCQDLTETDRAKGKEVTDLLIEATEFLSKKKVDQGAGRIRLAQEKLIAIAAAGNSKLVTELKASHFAIGQAIKMLTAAGQSFSPLPTFDELINNSFSLQAGQGNAETITKSLTTAGNLFKKSEFDKSAEQIRLAQKHMMAIPFTEDSKLIEQYKKDHRRIAKAQKLLTPKGFLFDPLPEIDTILSKWQGSGKKSNEDTDNKVAGVAGDAPKAASVPLTGMDKIAADRKKFFIDMMTLMGTVKDNASAKEAIPKFKALAVRIEAIANDTGKLIVSGGQAASQRFVEIIQAEQRDIDIRRAMKENKVDLSKYPELKKEVDKLGKLMTNANARGRRSRLAQ